MSNRTVITVSLNKIEAQKFDVAKDKVLDSFPESYREKVTNSEVIKLVLDSFLMADSKGVQKK